MSEPNLTPCAGEGKPGRSLVDITGKVFGKWTVLECAGKDFRGKVWWKCRCSCGTLRTVAGSHLKAGGSTNCGCAKIKDLLGFTVDTWTVVRYLGLDAKHTALWECRCVCGLTRTFKGWVLTGKRSPVPSCLCSRQEAMSRRARTHGESRTRLYRIWGDMHSRCYNPKSTPYRHYGGRGISMCKEWRDSYEAFRDWALANDYASDLTIERDETDGNYEPGNCRWISQSEQMVNTRRNVFYEAFGETKALSLWAIDPRCCVNYYTLRERLNRGWSPELAITTKPRVMTKRS